MPRYKVFFYEFQINGRNILDVGFLAKTRSGADKKARKVFKYLPPKTVMEFSRYLDRQVAEEWLS